MSKLAPKFHEVYGMKIAEVESEILGLKIARGDLLDLTSPDLVPELIKQKVDVLKLHIQEAPENLFQLLDALNMPYYLLGNSIRYKALLQRIQPFPYINENFRVEETDSHSSDLLMSLSTASFGSRSVSFFSNPGLHITDLETKQMDVFKHFLKSWTDENRFTHLCYIAEEPVGFMCSYQKANGGAVEYAGIIPSAANRGVYLDLISFIQNFGRSLGKAYATAAVQIQNIAGQKALQKRGMFVCGYELSVHINAFARNESNPRLFSV